MTGRGGPYGVDSVAAAEIAMEEINAKGGRERPMIDLIFTDDKSNTSYAVKVGQPVHQGGQGQLPDGGGSAARSGWRSPRCRRRTRSSSLEPTTLPRR